MIATPSHGNLGDQAIVYAQRRFLADALPDFAVFEIQRYQYELTREKIQEMVRPSDVVVVDGGGSVGTLWPEENDKINDIVRRFADRTVLAELLRAGHRSIHRRRTVWNRSVRRPALFARRQGTRAR